MITIFKWKDLYMFPYNAAKKTAGFLLKKQLLRKKTGAKFAPKKVWKKLLSRKHDGLLMNGADLHLTQPHSFQNVCAIARIGAGKTSRYIIPNIIDRGRFNTSIVVNDPSGEAYEQTSGYMQRKGFKIIVINPDQPQHSHRFNPLLEVQNLIELEQLAEIIINAGSKDAHKEPFWTQGATRLTAFFLKVLLNASHENEEYFSLENLYRLYQNYGNRRARVTRIYGDLYD